MTTAHGTWTTSAAVRAQPDGKIITAGETRSGPTEEIIATRYTAAGKLDQSFGAHGIATVSIGSLAGVDSGAALALQPDGKILIAGSGTVDHRLAFAAIRLTSRGRLDRTFGRRGIATVSIGTSAIANGVAVAPDGRILLGGVATVNGIRRFAIARLLADGSPDESFGARGVSLLGPPDAGAWGIALQTNGKPVLGGWGIVGGRAVYVVVRAMPNGAPDAAFGADGVVLIPIGNDARGDAIALQPDGGLVMSGDVLASGARTIATVRLRADGSIDRHFGSGGVATLSQGWGVNGIAIDRRGHILLAGGGPSLAVLNPNGTFDRAFANGGVFSRHIGRSASANGVAILPNDRFVLAGTTDLNGRIQQLVVRVSG